MTSTVAFIHLSSNSRSCVVSFCQRCGAFVAASPSESNVKKAEAAHQCAHKMTRLTPGQQGESRVKSDSKTRVLLADDEAMILVTLKAILEKEGYEVETAGSENDAVRRLAESEFHLVITDLRMEKADSGFAIAAAAKTQSYKPAVAILTAYPVLADEWHSKGADMLFLKPVNTSDMLRAIECLVYQSRQAS